MNQNNTITDHPTLEKKEGNKKILLKNNDIKFINHTDNELIKLHLLLEEKSKELDFTVPKCARCANPCKNCKLTFLKKQLV